MFICSFLKSIYLERLKKGVKEGDIKKAGRFTGKLLKINSIKEVISVLKKNKGEVREVMLIDVTKYLLRNGHLNFSLELMREMKNEQKKAILRELLYKGETLKEQEIYLKIELLDIVRPIINNKERRELELSIGATF